MLTFDLARKSDTEHVIIEKLNIITTARALAGRLPKPFASVARLPNGGRRLEMGLSFTQRLTPAQGARLSQRLSAQARRARSRTPRADAQTGAAGVAGRVWVKGYYRTQDGRRVWVPGHYQS